MHSLQGNRTQLRPGFPIRTSSDQRFIDNSPRLNAALHVLHRLSMPRHPPCALNNEHTNHHTQTTRPIHLCLMLASTIQFSHNTPTTPHQHNKCQQALWSGTKKGDNAPDTQQCTNIQTTLFLVQLCMDNVCHKAPFKHLVRLLSVCFTRTIFIIKRPAA